MAKLHAMNNLSSGTEEENSSGFNLNRMVNIQNNVILKKTAYTGG